MEECICDEQECIYCDGAGCTECGWSGGRACPVHDVWGEV